jgi:NAD+ kinase
MHEASPKGPERENEMIGRIGLVVHGGKPAAVAAAEGVREWAAQHAVPCVDIDVWKDGTGDIRLDATEEASRAGDPDLIVTVGGDGTFLRGVRIAAPSDSLVLGVNVGHVGFLTEVSVGELAAALDAVHEGRSQIDARLMLTMRASRPLEVPVDLEGLIRYGRGPALPPPAVRDGDAENVGWGVPLDVLALNDVVFEKLARDRQLTVGVYVDGRLFAYYAADALIVSSSTGSTAYSFAAGGPVMSPDLDALIFTPVAPQMVFDRSLILSRRHRVGVRVLEHSGQVLVSVDGQVRGVLDPGDWVTVYAGGTRAKLVRLADVDFLSRVRRRFGLLDAAAALADGTVPAVYRPASPLPPDLADPGPPE